MVGSGWSFLAACRAVNQNSPAEQHDPTAKQLHHCSFANYVHAISRPAVAHAGEQGAEYCHWSAAANMALVLWSRKSFCRSVTAPMAGGKLRAESCDVAVAARLLATR